MESDNSTKQTISGLKVQRKTLRGRITRLANAIDRMRDIPLREISGRELKSKRTQLKESILNHQAAQASLNILMEGEGATLEVLETEAEAAETLNEVHIEALDMANQLLERYDLYESAQSIQKDFDRWLELAGPSSVHYERTCEKLSQSINTFMKCSASYKREEDINVLRDTFEKHLTAIQKGIFSLKMEDKKPAPSREIKSTTEPTSSGSKFNIDLPKFSGEPLEWERFHSLFTSTMKSRGSDLSDSERCCLLLKSMTAKRAQDIVLDHQTGDNCYDQAMENLVEAFGSPHILYPHHIQALIKQDTYTYDKPSLYRIRIRLKQQLHAMKKLDGCTAEQIAAALVLADFDQKMREEWMRFMVNIKGLPSADDILNFTVPLEKCMNDDYIVASNSLSLVSNTSSPASTINKSNPVKSESRRTATSTRGQCELCREVHGLARCSVFLGYDINRRYKYLKDKRWCTNCLHPSHTCSQCASSFSCKHCKGRHHTLLHKDDFERPTSSQTSLYTTTSLITDKYKTKKINSNHSPPICGFLNTALVEAVCGERKRLARAALDSGASSSIITESLASHLRLQRFPHRMIVQCTNGESVSRHYVKVPLRSTYDPEKSITLNFSVVSKLPPATPPVNKEVIKANPILDGLDLADSDFGGPLDLIIGILDVTECSKSDLSPKQCSTTKISASPTIFGWTVAGPMTNSSTSTHLKIDLERDTLNEDLQRLWELDRTPEIKTALSDEDSATSQFLETVSIESSGRYIVKLPRIADPPTLGDSKPMAISRFLQNERTLKKREKLAEFSVALNEYIALDHAEVVPKSQLNISPRYYLPIHGIFKQSSTTTKVRPVFDASAKTTNGISLNDLLLPGPNVYPLLTDILIKFRKHSIAFSADISKMFREILLDEKERDLHRFLIRSSSGDIVECRMKRLTFGVKSSPFLANRVIKHLADSHTDTHPEASEAIRNLFYVDDLLSGTDSIEEAVRLREQLCHLLGLAGMTLRKWRSNNNDFKKTIPSSLIETEDLLLPASTSAPKALGTHWDVGKDNLHVSVPQLQPDKTVTKRYIASQTAKVFDVLGFFSPHTIVAKIILQRLWKLDVTWDEEVPEIIEQQWSTWEKDLPSLSTFPIPRRYTSSDIPVVSMSIHGFSDASQVAYGAAIYIRNVHSDNSITTALVMAKARVAPLKTRTIPETELIAALLMAKLLVYVAERLNISTDKIYAWTDSSIVLSWLRKMPTALKTFVSHRTAAIQELTSISHWRHVATDQNPADLPSRGLTASKLLTSKLWWFGPDWLSLQSVGWPSSGFTLLRELPEMRTAVLMTVIAQQPAFDMWDRYSSFSRLTRILSWIRRFCSNLKKRKDDRIRSSTLSSAELSSTKKFIIIHSQKQSFPEVYDTIRKKTSLNKQHCLSKLQIHLSTDGVIKVTGRIRDDSSHPKSLIPLSLKNNITRLLVSSAHGLYLHPGVAALLSILGDSYFIPGLRNFIKKLSKTCATCQRAYSRPLHQRMGLLPSVRTTPSPPFTSTGVDFAGPFTLRLGHTRKPVLVKSYACVFVCLVTRVIHIELCGGLDTDEFMAALRRFCSRRGTPATIYSDNGTNFVGAYSEIKDIQRLLSSAKTSISHLCTDSSCEWHFIPPRTPHFGGLWEAGVKAMKLQLRKLVSPHPLRFAELYTVLTEAEAILNSRPLAPLNSTEADQDLVITPGHFIIGRPLKSPPTRPASNAQMSSLRRWALVQRLQQDLWQSWKGCYLQSIQCRKKWNITHENIRVNDIVYLKDEVLSSHRWPLARVMKVYPGDDGLVRTVDVLAKGKIYKRSTHRLIPILMDDVSLPPPEHVQVPDHR